VARTRGDAVPVPAGALWRLCGWLALPYAASVLALSGAGIQATPPWRIVLPVAAVALPYAYCLARLVFGIGGLFLRRPVRFRLPAGVLPVGVLLGSLCLVLLPPLGDRLGIVLLSFYALLAVDARRLPAGYVRALAAALCAIGIGLATVCNINYLLAPVVSGALKDPALMRLDLALYEWALGQPVSYRALFPLVRSPLAFRVLETAYQALFAEFVLVVLVLLRQRRDPTPFLRTVFLGYFAAAVAFAAYPAVGPCIHYPESFGTAFRSTATRHLMERLAAEFAAAAAREPGTGFAYFIAIPSLHAALATICQRYLAAAPLFFWTFAPVNGTVLASTVLLGHHYLIDVPCGVLLALGAIWAVERVPEIRGRLRHTGRTTSEVSELRLPLPPAVSLTPLGRTGS
jgi:hypothetical protein